MPTMVMALFMMFLVGVIRVVVVVPLPMVLRPCMTKAHKHPLLGRSMAVEGDLDCIEMSICRRDGSKHHLRFARQLEDALVQCPFLGGYVKVLPQVDAGPADEGALSGCDDRQHHVGFMLHLDETILEDPPLRVPAPSPKHVDPCVFHEGAVASRRYAHHQVRALLQGNISAPGVLRHLLLEVLPPAYAPRDGGRHLGPEDHQNCRTCDDERYSNQHEHSKS
mmetsp:Transcript_59297/g.150161  ORF Transcript_59297/g.150161 Transcript_59297/m.150161 type:complete len:222 (+) Transcript_59297:2522-3187(+)